MISTFQLRYVCYFFRYNAIAYLIDYSIVLTLLLYVLGNQKIPIDLLYCSGLGLNLQYLCSLFVL